MLKEEVQPEETVVKERTMTLSDRCDSCGAEAFVWANGVTGDLFFCAHHFNKWESKIREFAFEIIDEREWINKKPSSGE